MTIGDLPTGKCSLVLCLRNGEKLRKKGKIIEDKKGKRFITRSSPRQSFSSSTEVLEYRNIA